MYTYKDLVLQVATYTHPYTADYNIDAVVREIMERGYCDVDSMSTDEFIDILQTHDKTENN